MPYGLDLNEVYGMKVDNGKKEDRDAMVQEQPALPKVDTPSVMSVLKFTMPSEEVVQQ